MCMCVDYWGLNAITIKNKYPLSNVDEFFDQIKEAWFSFKIDLNSRYHKVHIHVDDITKGAFCTHYGHYEFLVKPFGLTSALSTFMMLMDNVF